MLYLQESIFAQPEELLSFFPQKTLHPTTFRTTYLRYLRYLWRRDPEAFLGLIALARGASDATLVNRLGGVDYAPRRILATKLRQIGIDALVCCSPSSSSAVTSHEWLGHRRYLVSKDTIGDDPFSISRVESEPDPFPFPDLDQLKASTVQFLIDGDEYDVAALLLACQIQAVHGREYIDFDQLWRTVDFVLSGPRAAYDAFSDGAHPHYTAVMAALRAVLPHPYQLNNLRVRAELISRGSLPPKWEAEYMEVIRGRGINNQLGPVDRDAPVHTWLTLKFRSQAEVRIAQALDRAGVLFLPNCRVRVTGPSGRVTPEPDFLVCKDGKWGLLEVDGAPYHPVTRTVHDHARDRLFLGHGLRVAQHYDATECYNAPEKVVASFLRILDQSG